MAKKFEKKERMPEPEPEPQPIVPEDAPDKGEVIGYVKGRPVYRV